MKNVLAIVAFMLSLCAFGANAYRFVSYNVWGDYFGNPPHERDKGQLAVLLNQKPDFIALQEFTPNYWKSALASGLEKDFEAVGRGLGADGKDSYTPLFYRRTRFRLLEKGAECFFPELDGSKSFVYAALEDVATGRRIVAFSTHFWWKYDGEADGYLRMENSRKVYKVVSAVAKRHNAEIVGGGDLNASISSRVAHEWQHLGWCDARLTTDGAYRGKTWREGLKRDCNGVYRGEMPEMSSKSSHLDYVFYAPGKIRPVAFRLDFSKQALDLSDHLPVVFRFLLEDNAPRPVATIASLAAKPQNSALDSWWMKRVEEKKRLSWQKPADIVFIGDSITHRWESSGKNVWNRFFAEGKYAALNMGFSADRTEHVLWRLYDGALDHAKFKAVVLMIGTNNAGHNDFSKCPPADVVAGIKAIIDFIRDRQPEARIVLHPIFPRGATKDNPLRVRNEIVNRELVRFADSHHVIWCDFNDQLLDNDANLSREVMPDLLHPAQCGYEVWANALLPVLNNILSAGKDEPIAGRYSIKHCARSIEMPSACRPETRLDAGGSRGKGWWLDRLAEKRAQICASGGEFDLVMIGDSITHFWEFDCDSFGYGVYRKLCEGRKVLNLGYGGDHTEHVLWRLENGELEGYRAKTVMLMIGTNNRDVPTDTAKGVEKILDLIKQKQPGARILLSPIFPRGRPDDKNRARNEEVNRLIKNFADGEKVLWIDFNSEFLEKDGTMRQGVMMNDLLHPVKAGYEIWLKELEKYL